MDKGTASEEYCLGLVISDKKVKSAIWSLSGTSDSFTPGNTEGWSNESAEELIVASDASIASAVTKLPYLEGKQPTKVILGLPEHWIEKNSVNPRKSLILQKVCQKLLLKSLGFVVTPEAIAHYLQIEEGGLPSIILINLNETEVVVSLITKGKFLGSKLVGRSDNLSLDLEEGLLRFDYQGVLPNRILLLADGDLTTDMGELKQNLVAYPWVGPENEKKLNFLQLPKVDIATEDFEIKAVVIAGKDELGLGSTREKLAPEKIKTEEVIPEVMKEAPVQSEEKTVPFAPMDEIFSEEATEDFGFIKDKDILLDQVSIAEEVPLIGEKKAPAIETEVVSSSPLIKPVIKEKKFVVKKIIALIFSKLKLVKNIKLFSGVTRPQPRFVFNKALLLFIIGVFIAGGLGLFSFYRLAKAEVKIFVQPQKVEKEFGFTVSAKTSAVDTEKMTLPAREITVDVSGTKTVDVNGKKTIGDHAKGEVSVYNVGNNVITLAKGIVVKGPGVLKFTFDTETKIASASVDRASSPPQIKPGEGKVSMTAVEIGAQYNVVANSEFVPEKGATSNLIIKNLNAFSGGSSREIQAVVKEDRDNLQAALLSELQKKASEEIKTKLSPKDYLLPDSLTLKSKGDQFNHEVGDEAATLTLEEKATFAVSYLQEADFKIIADKNISELIPEGYQKEPTKEESNFTLQDKVKGAYIAKVSGEFIPVLGIERIPKQLAAKSITKGEKFLNNFKQVTGINVTIRPKIFSFLKIFPLRQQNITVVVESL